MDPDIYVTIQARRYLSLSLRAGAWAHSNSTDGLLFKEAQVN